MIIRTNKPILVTALAFAVLYSIALLRAQMPMRDAAKLALINSPQLKAAQNDLDKANTNLSVMKDIYVPSVTTSGGVGYTTGITLSVPTVFTVNAQSLVFSLQQREYTRSAHEQIDAAKLAMEEARQQVLEDVVITYISIDQAIEVDKVLTQQYEFSNRLAEIDEDRQHSGLESELEVMKAKRGAVQIKLLQMQAEQNVINLRGHLASLTGQPIERIETVSASIPALPSVASLGSDDQIEVAPTPGLLAAQANVISKQHHARGDEEYAWRPQVTFGAGYGRVSPINNVTQFYNLHGDYNTTNVGIQIQVPILDRVRRDAARESRAEASRAALDLDNLRAEQNGSRVALHRSLPALATKVDLAQLDLDIAQNELSSTTLQARGATGRPPLTPKEEESAHIDERQKYLNLLDARLGSEKAEINYLRQIGKLKDWIDPAESSALLPSAQTKR